MEVGSDCENSVINTPEQMSARGLVNSFNQTAGRHIRFRLLRRWKPACKKNIYRVSLKKRSFVIPAPLEALG